MEKYYKVIAFKGGRVREFPTAQAFLTCAGRIGFINVHPGDVIGGWYVAQGFTEEKERKQRPRRELILRYPDGTAKDAKALSLERGVTVRAARRYISQIMDGKDAQIGRIPPRPCKVDGVEFSSLRTGAAHLGMSVGSVYYRMKKAEESGDNFFMIKGVRFDF